MSERHPLLDLGEEYVRARELERQQQPQPPAEDAVVDPPVKDVDVTPAMRRGPARGPVRQMRRGR